MDEAATIARDALASADNDGSVQVARFVVDSSGGSMDAQAIQQDIRQASSQRMMTLVITPAMVEARMSDEVIRERLIEQLPVTYKSYSALCGAVALFTAIDHCMQHPSDSAYVDKAVKELKASGVMQQDNPRECLVAMVNSLILIEKQKPEERPGGYELVAVVKRRHVTRLDAVDRGVVAYREAVAAL